MAEMIYYISLLIYPIVFVIFMLLAILAIVDNVNRLKHWERIAFHAILAVFFLVVALRTNIVDLIDVRVGLVIARIILFFLIPVTLPSILRSLRALWCEQHDCKKRKSDARTS